MVFQAHADASSVTLSAASCIMATARQMAVRPTVVIYDYDVKDAT